MALTTVFEQDFSNAMTDYDQAADVLYLSMGEPVPSTCLQIDDWLAIRVPINAPTMISGVTVVGFKQILKRIDSYWDRIAEEMPSRVARLNEMTYRFEYDQAQDVALFSFRGNPETFYFERLAPYLQLKRSLSTGDVIGIVVDHFSRNQATVMKRIYIAFKRELFGHPKKRDLTGEHILGTVLVTFFAHQLRKARAA